MKTLFPEADLFLECGEDASWTPTCAPQSASLSRGTSSLCSPAPSSPAPSAPPRSAAAPPLPSFAPPPSSSPLHAGEQRDQDLNSFCVIIPEFLVQFLR